MRCSFSAPTALKSTTSSKSGIATSKCSTSSRAPVRFNALSFRSGFSKSRRSFKESNMRLRVFVGMLLVSGCFGQAVMVRRDLYGGTLALRGMHDEAMKDAYAQMSNHCRGPYTIVSEENAVVGQQ